ncbi:MAG: type 12 methyltransferase [Anaerolineaceae bacterium]|nr:MAG: type 12 methyltransferase [Anaerolineaceae bacterium]
MTASNRAEHEIAHGRKLSEAGAEQVWGWGTPAGQVRFRRRADWIAAQAGLRSGVRVLEIGCGTGNFTEVFAASGADLLALDISEDLLERARERRLPGNVRFVCQPFETLDEAGGFDAVIGSSVLHHLDIHPALAEIFRLLRSPDPASGKPGGVMAFAEPNMLNPQIMIEKNIPWIKERMGDSPDETAFFRWQMRRLLREAGFTGIEVTPRDWLHPAIPPAAIGFFEKVGSALEKIPLVREFAGSLYICARRPAGTGGTR